MFNLIATTIKNTWKVPGLSAKRRRPVSRFRLTPRFAEIYEYVNERFIKITFA